MMGTNTVPMPSDFILNTKEKCFLCLGKVIFDNDNKVEADEGYPGPFDLTSRPTSSTTHSLHYLTRYLRMSLRTVLNQNLSGPAPPQQLLNKLDRSKLKVSLCAGCALLHGRFLELYGQQERIRVELASCLSAIHGRLTRAREEEDHFLDGVLTKHEKKMMHTLRNEAMQKCKLRLERYPPAVKVKNLFIIQVAAEREELRLKSKSNSTGTPRPQHHDQLDHNLAATATSTSPLISPNVKVEVGSIKMESLTANDTDDDDPSWSDQDDQDRESKYEPENPQPSPSKNGPSHLNKIVNSKTLSRSDVSRKYRNSYFEFDPATQRYKCRQTGCGKQFRSRTGVYKHRKVFHLGLKLICAGCSKSLTSKSSLNHHQRSCPGKIKTASASDCLERPGRFQCRLCRKQFKNNCNLSRHNREVHQRISHKCKSCGEGFFSRCARQLHYEKVHLGVTYKCNDCSTVLGSEFALKKHKEKSCSVKKNLQCSLGL